MQPTLEEKQHVLELLQELKGYVQDIPQIIQLSRAERTKIADRMIAIKEELKKFRENYPHA
jgi:hypothetical protein